MPHALYLAVGGSRFHEDYFLQPPEIADNFGIADKVGTYESAKSIVVNEDKAFQSTQTA